ncbi:hypothetical protein D3C77_552270 [compost metagenome]
MAFSCFQPISDSGYFQAVVGLYFNPPLPPIREENLYIRIVFEVALGRRNTLFTGLGNVADDCGGQLKKTKKCTF